MHAPGSHAARTVAACTALTGAVAFFAASAQATPGAYSDEATFAAAAPGPVQRFDFEALSDGAVVSGSIVTPTGASVGIVLPPAVPDLLDPGGPALDLRVVENAGDNPASSGVRSLGVEDPGNFHGLVAGTTLAFSFTQPIDAFGLVLVTPEEPGAALFDLDARLEVPGESTAVLSLGAGQPLGSFGGREYFAYFLGVVGAASFNQATLVYDPSTPDAGFLFNADDLAIAVPEPGGVLSLLAGLLLLAGLPAHRTLCSGTPCSRTFCSRSLCSRSLCSRTRRR